MPTTIAADDCTVYVSSSESREIHVFGMDSSTGDLALLEVHEVPGTGAPTRGNMPLAIDPAQRTLYAHVRAAPAYPITAYAIDSTTGRLQPMSTADMPAPMAYLSITSDGQHLLGASYDDAMLSVHRIGKDHRIETPPLQTLPTPPKAHWVRQAPAGNVVYATSVTGETILGYRFDLASGHLVHEPSACVRTPDGAGPRHIAFHPSLDTLYCVNEHDGSMGVYRVDRATGKLHPLQMETLVPADFSGNALGADIHLTPDGAYVYASVRKTNSLTAFRMNSLDGQVTRVGTFEVEPYPRGFAIDPSGRYLFCAGQGNDTLARYRIDHATGHLVLEARYPVGKRPSWIEILPARN